MSTVRHALTSEGVILAALALLTAQGGFAQASGYATVYSFKGGSDGASPEGVILGTNGALYGTTLYGGANTCETETSFYLCGTVFELAPAKEVPWTKTVLYSFNGASGALPSYGARLAFGKNGALYGTTAAGGSNDSSGTPAGGAVFELAPPANAGGTWTESVLYSFPHNYEEPNTPLSGVFIGSEGALYGTTWASHYNTAGGSWGGSVFRLTPPSAPGGNWTESTLWDFYANGASLGSRSKCRRRLRRRIANTGRHILTSTARAAAKSTSCRLPRPQVAPGQGRRFTVSAGQAATAATRWPRSPWDLVEYSMAQRSTEGLERRAYFCRLPDVERFSG
jgi:hypothetical protein